MSACDGYGAKFKKLKIRYNRLFETESAHSSEEKDVHTENGVFSNERVSGKARKFKLPQLELMKFGGDIREWLPFWSQFKKIDEDEELAPEDKFQYLLLAISHKTRARNLVESFPSTKENYAKAIDCLKSRFGRDDLRIEVYVRELLKLVINNTTSSRKFTISTLYDKVETQLRALETLGITTDTCAAMLYPSDESCLPEELLRAWQRSTDFYDKKDTSLKTRLQQLMRFMKAEVEGEERILLAVEGFDLKSQDSSKKNKVKFQEPTVCSAAGLMNSSAERCVLCDGNHMVEKCFRAKKMTSDKKKQSLVDKGACFKCAKVGHRSRRCPEKLRCLICGRSHISILCAEIQNKSSNPQKVEPSKDETVKNTVEVGLANYTRTRVFLQILVVKIYSEQGEEEGRAVIDTGSQRSYVLKDVVQKLKYQPKCELKIIHALFGGTRSSKQPNTCYDVCVKNVDGSFACRFEALDQSTICNNLIPVTSGVWDRELKEKDINITDRSSNKPIVLLIGADIAGKLLTGKRLVLSCGLVAMETLLGWVMMGKIPGEEKEMSSAMIATSLLCNTSAIESLWKLDVLGISDPGEKRTKAEEETMLRDFFEQTVSINAEGCYEVSLPWKEGHPPLPSNYVVAKKSLVTMKGKLVKNKALKQYEDVFEEWIKEGIIEKVEDKNPMEEGNYLPHRPVFKATSSTTKIRPVFDASAKENGKPSLNDCLETGINLIEKIPTLLLRFRMGKIGITSDIRKAFLQISIHPDDQNFLRFLTVEDDDEVDVLRHRRVVFGVTSCPLLLGATIDYHLKTCLEKCNDARQVYSRETITKLQSSFYLAL